MKIQIPDDFMPETKIISARGDIFYEAELMEIIKIKAGKYSKNGENEMAFCYLCYDSDKKEYLTVAEAVIWSRKSTKLLNILTAIAGKTVRPNNLPKDFDLDWILHKHFSIKFAADAEQRYPKIVVRQYRKSENCNVFNLSVYSCPTWVQSRLASEADETFDGDISEIFLKNPDVAMDSIEISVEPGSVEPTTHAEAMLTQDPITTADLEEESDDGIEINI